RLEQLIRLFEQIGPQRFVCLLAVPRTAARRAQPVHDLEDRGYSVGVRLVHLRFDDSPPHEVRGYAVTSRGPLHAMKATEPPPPDPIDRAAPSRPAAPGDPAARSRPGGASRSGWGRS